MIKHWTPRELTTLRSLREGFLSREAGWGDYWKSAENLALYDATFGERIGWKWDAVLGELTVRGWTPRSRHLLDFGCGSGIAGRRVAAHWPSHFTSLTLHDRSPAAMHYAAARAREIPGLRVRAEQSIDAHLEDTLVVLSHVINELPPSALRQVLASCQRAQEIIWVEAGTHPDSRQLIAEIREPLLATGRFTVVAPCTHQARCGMLSEKNAPHWCHHFARPPSSAFQDAAWAEFSHELGIDLRALPYSFLVMERTKEPLAKETGLSRVIGKAREYKGFSKVLSCQAEGVSEFMLQKRDAPALFRELRDPAGSLACYRWELQDGKIVQGTRAYADETEGTE